MSSTVTRPSLLLVSHAYAALENRKKVQALAAYFDLVCVTSILRHAEILGQSAAQFDNDSDAPGRRYDLIRMTQRGPSITSFIYPELGSLMRQRQFDVILVENEPWSLVCWQARLLTGLFQKKALFGEFTWENVERPGLKGIVLRRVYQAMTATTDFVICGNTAGGEIMRRRGMPLEDILVAPQMGVDVTNHHPAPTDERRRLREKNHLPIDAFIIGYCGRYTEEKGLLELLEACETLRSSPQHHDLHLAFVGAGRMEGWLKEQAAAKPWLHLLPPRPHFEVPDFLRCLDVFVLGSKPVLTRSESWEEQFGHVLIEAMACGVPTIGSTSGAIPEVLGEPSAVFPWGDAAALTALLRQLKENSTRYEALRAHQLSHVRQQYTHEALARQWAAFVHQKLAA